MNITVKNLQNSIAISPRVLAAMRKVIRKTWQLKYRKSNAGQITVCLVDNGLIRKLNLQYLGRDRSTDVLAFNLSSKPYAGLAADIIVSTETAVSNARAFKTSALYETLLYVTHGLLHMLGYDDKNPRQRKIINNKAVRILKSCHVHP